MTDLEIKQYLAKELTKENIYNNKTVLLIGNASKLFKSIYIGDIISISTAEETKEFINEYNMQSEKPLVFEDISLMQQSVQSYLLKFIEDFKRPLIVLASIDNISPIILSRFRKVIKIPSDNKYSNISLDKFLEEHQNELKSNYVLPELKQESLLYCPEYYYRYVKLNISSHDNKNRNQLMKLM